MSSIASPGSEYEAQSYWSQRLGNDFSLVGVGYKALGARFNGWQYRAYVRNLERAERRFGFDLATDSILECGFGTGFFLDYYYRRGNRDFTGIDLTEVAVHELRGRYPDARFEQADLGAGPIDLGRKFDVATAFAVLLHITDDDHFERAVANVCRHSSQWVLITEVAPKNRFAAPGKSHYVLRSRDQLESELRKHGLEVVGIEPVFALLASPTPVFKPWFYFWNAALYAMCRTEFTGHLTGATLYGLDGLLTGPLRLNPSVDLLVARRT